MEANELYVGIVGSRKRTSLVDREAVFNIINRLNILCKKELKELVIVSGACYAGADKFADDICSFLNVRIINYPIDIRHTTEIKQKNYKYKYTQAAYDRNRSIAEHSKNALFALVSDDRKGGTENTIKQHLEFSKSDQGHRRKTFIVDRLGRISQIVDG